MRKHIHPLAPGSFPPAFVAGPGQAGPDSLGFGPGPRAFRAGRRGFGPHRFGPPAGGFAGRARRGDVRNALLGLLADGPSTGYGLIKAIAEKTGGAWEPSPGSVYPTLAQLVDEGLVGKAGDDGQRGEYTLTDDGQQYVRANSTAIEAALNNAEDEASVANLRDAARKLMGSVMQFRSATDDQRARATDKLNAVRKELYAILGE